MSDPTVIIATTIKLISSAKGLLRGDRIKQVKIKKLRRHYNEWLEDRSHYHLSEQTRFREEMNNRGLLESGVTVAGLDAIDDKYIRDLERKKSDIEDEIKLIHLGD